MISKEMQNLLDEIKQFRPQTEADRAAVHINLLLLERAAEAVPSQPVSDENVR